MPSISSEEVVAATDGGKLSVTEIKNKDIMSMTEPSDDGSDGHLASLRVDSDKKDKYMSFRTRTIWTIVLISGFITVIAAGHFYCTLLVLLLSVGIFKEIISLKRNVEKDKRLPYFYALRWFFFIITMFYLVKKVLPEQLDRLALEFPALAPVLKYHGFISYNLFCGGIILFVLSLRRFTLRYQFTQLSWTMVSLSLLVTQSVGHIANIYAGLVWFLLPTTCVIINDITAYLFGFFLGRTPLIKLSPKKTWEGFIGGTVCTILWAVYFAGVVQKYPFFVCPEQRLITGPFERLTADATCNVNTGIFEKDINLLETGFLISELQLHALFLGAFASLVAPFGGFFASGFKRAFKIKDFGDSIPGHGGITDRFDCQIIVGMFTYIYITTYVISKTANNNAVDAILRQIGRLNETQRHTLLSTLLTLANGGATSTAAGNTDL